MEQNIIQEILTKVCAIFQDEDSINLNNVSVEIPKNKSHGDFSTNAALVLSKNLKNSPRNIAEIIKNCLDKDDIFTDISIAGPGFVNFVLSKEYYQNKLANIYDNIDSFGKHNFGNGTKVNIEFGSPNPTGPVHIGHSRSLILGSTIANLLKFVGFDVTCENYFNDAGGQIDILAKSLYIRYQEILEKQSIQIPKGLYPGSYLIEIAQKLINLEGNKFLGKSESEYLPFFRAFATDHIKEMIITSFNEIGVTHDVNSSELELHKQDKINQAITKLTNLNLTYYGTLEKPKGHDTIKTDEKDEMLLFKSSDFGDSSDRSLQKSDKSWTYFAADIAYHKDKIDRGFDQLILLLGADHGGYTKRISAAVNALSGGKVQCTTILCQLVNFLKNGEPLKMSKRAGNYITMDDVVEQIGSDALRLLMLMRKNDTVFDFDLQKALEQTKDNPVFYIQYAHARIASVIRNLDFQTDRLNADNIKLLSDKSETDLIKKITLFPHITKLAGQNFDPHILTTYIYELTSLFHSYWNLGKNRSDLRFISSDKNITEARIILLLVIQNIIAKVLRILNIEPLEKME
ncbi:MAG: arginine--tRNA ligase [Rickettsiales bacterium]|nr:arginine--tRNA ligase [Rickettsiales bacterium]